MIKLVTFASHLSHLCHTWSSLSHLRHSCHTCQIWVTLVTHVSHLCDTCHICQIWVTLVTHVSHLCHTCHICQIWVTLVALVKYESHLSRLRYTNQMCHTWSRVRHIRISAGRSDQGDWEMHRRGSPRCAPPGLLRSRLNVDETQNQGFREAGFRRDARCSDTWEMSEKIHLRDEQKLVGGWVSRGLPGCVLQACEWCYSEVRAT